jgi:DNA polymerase I-like protein with 3'-5' exonuclease and polymerase domains
MKILFLGTEADRPYLSHIRQHVSSFSLRQHDFIEEIVLQYGKTGTTHIVTTQQSLIPLLCHTASSKEQTLDNYAGSWVTHQASGMHFLFVHPLKQCLTVPHGMFLLERYISKFTKPNNWVTTDTFNWKILETLEDYDDALISINSASLCAVDIETRPDLSISCISYTCVNRGNTGSWQTSTYVMPLPYNLDEDDYHIRYQYLAKFNNTPQTPKILQNGKYDCAYLQRYNIPLAGYMFDTQLCHHAWYAELPKALDIIATFYIRQSCFWKNEGDTGNTYDLYYYNALDTWHTAWVFIQWLVESPSWAKHNYLLSFQTVAPNFLMESTGLAVNYEQFYEVQAEHQGKKEAALAELRASIGNANYNPGSSQQNLKLLHILGCKDVKNADAKVMNRVSHRHPFIALLVELISNYSKAAKLVSTYLNEEKHFNGRALYSLNPTTDTGRNKSKRHHFWTGFNIQNIPRSGGIKRFIQADEDFLIMEADYAQAESRDTGYITGDLVLIDNVESDRDFHKSNASMFFGVPYEQVDKELRQLGKPVNHGKNYMMGEETLIDSMGLANIFRVQSRLGLPKYWTPKQVAKYLGDLFDNVYPVVSKEYPQWIKEQVLKCRMLVNPYGWVRYCFGDPIKNKSVLRALVAHLPQGTNAQALNLATRLVFDRVWKPNSDNFKMNAQIHDSLLFQTRLGHEHLAQQVADCMLEASTIDVTDIKGVTRRMRIPVDLSSGGKSWADSKD